MSDERFARQYRFGLPPGFLLASTCTSIVHHLSGPSAITLARCFTEDPTPPVVQFFENVSHFWLPCVWRFEHPQTRNCIRLLGPCFKTGEIKPPNQKVFVMQTRPRTDVRFNQCQSFAMTSAKKHGHPGLLLRA